MKLIFEPTIHNAWDSMYAVGLNEYSEFEPHANHLDGIPEIAGRVCYQSFSNPRPGGNQAYLKHILEAGHGSVLEHSHVGFVITGVSRSLTHELIRHKAGTAFSELSQRYVDPSDLGFVVPPLMIDDDSAVESFRSSCAVAKTSYEKQIVACTRLASEDWQRKHVGENPTRADLTMIRKRAREAARSVLPNCTETHVCMTANFRAWRNIIEQRACMGADLEIRRMFVYLCERLKKLAPSVFQDFIISTDLDGFLSAQSQYRKV